MRKARPLSRSLARLVAALAMMTGSATCAWSVSVKPLQIAGSISAADWEAYRSRFVDGSGRVVDNANGDISHSEGQGYGMILAFAAGDRRTFEQIWNFTYTELLIRDDDLAAWKWDPRSKPRVSDKNNATDGDILIAYALAKAGAAWRDARYTAAAQKLAKAIGKTLIDRNGSTTFLLPAADGFRQKDRGDGPVINLSYWIFEAFPVLAALAPEYDWSRVWRDGVMLLQQTTSGRVRLPSDWTSIRSSLQIKPAEGFEPQFSYNAIRIPLYLLRAGMTEIEWLRLVKQRWAPGAEGVAVVDVTTGQVRERLTDQGYIALHAALACALDGTPVPASLKRFEPKFYYPSTLYLLSKSLLAERYPQCA